MFAVMGDAFRLLFDGAQAWGFGYRDIIVGVRVGSVERGGRAAQNRVLIRGIT